MKRGKSIKLNLLDNAKTSYGTVDSKELKSIYVNFQSWVIPKMSNQNWERVVSTIKRELKYTINDDIDTKIFKDFFIVDLDLRFSGILTGKRSFFNLEITLYTNSNVEFKSTQIKESVKKMIHSIYKHNISNNKYFDFYLTKKNNDDKQSESIYLC